jgi:hypothetical protein
MHFVCLHLLPTLTPSLLAHSGQQDGERSTDAASSGATSQLAPEVLELIEDYAILAKRYQSRLAKYMGHLARAHVEQVIMALLVDASLGCSETVLSVVSYFIHSKNVPCCGMGVGTQSTPAS